MRRYLYDSRVTSWRQMMSGHSDKIVETMDSILSFIYRGSNQTFHVKRRRRSGPAAEIVQLLLCGIAEE